MEMVNIQELYKGVLEESVALNNIMVKLISGKKLEDSIETIHKTYSDYYGKHKNIYDNLAAFSMKGYSSLAHMEPLFVSMKHNITILEEVIKRAKREQALANTGIDLNAIFSKPVKISMAHAKEEDDEIKDKHICRIDEAPKDLLYFIGARYKPQVDNLHNHIMQFMPYEDVLKAFKQLPVLNIKGLNLKQVRRELSTPNLKTLTFLASAFYIVLSEDGKKSDVCLICSSYRKTINAIRAGK